MADKYIFGSQGNSYANIESFNMNNIKVYFQEYKHPIYNQLYGRFYHLCLLWIIIQRRP